MQTFARVLTYDGIHCKNYTYTLPFQRRTLQETSFEFLSNFKDISEHSSTPRGLQTTSNQSPQTNSSSSSVNTSTSTNSSSSSSSSSNSTSNSTNQTNGTNSTNASALANVTTDVYFYFIPDLDVDSDFSFSTISTESQKEYFLNYLRCRINILIMLEKYIYFFN